MVDTRAPARPAGLTVVAAAVVEHGRLLVVSKQAAPDLFYLPGGKPEPGEDPVETLTRELDEELGAAPVAPRLLTRFEGTAALERVPMQLSVYTAQLDAPPVPAAELAHMHWTTGEDEGLHLSPALTQHVLPVLRARGVLGAAV
ncbi:NUDIX hydrolase [Streptomyces xiaopingdaonensis]|uniref:NUDIX hydrolase n=1 Tax=Streptomyces xiaopingdaonensis TaxID=1565415 RepID=UPI000526C4EA|nr:NUDIX domain-containing protein [Streptomyces xiaopingdaonensis]